MSTRDDWYRKETWSTDDAADFEKRLSRSRGQRIQYLKLQAWHLAETRKPSLAAPAIELASRCIQEDPKGFFEVDAYLIIADASITLGDTDGALSAYRAAIEAESRRPNPRHLAYLQYAWYVATTSASGEFENALKAMEQMEKTDLIFPITQYKYFGALALISEALGDVLNARRMARDALEAEKKSGPFPGREDMGAVRDIDATIRKRIEQLAA